VIPLREDGGTILDGADQVGMNTCIDGTGAKQFFAAFIEDAKLSVEWEILSRAPDYVSIQLECNEATGCPVTISLKQHQLVLFRKDQLCATCIQMRLVTCRELDSANFFLENQSWSKCLPDNPDLTEVVDQVLMIVYLCQTVFPGDSDYFLGFIRCQLEACQNPDAVLLRTASKCALGLQLKAPVDFAPGQPRREHHRHYRGDEEQTEDSFANPSG